MRLTEAAVQALKEHLARQIEQMERLGDLYEDQGLIFATQRGTLVNPTNLGKRSFAPILEKAGLLPIRFHDLRHTCATLLLSRNVNPKIVSEMLGHATIAITLDTTPTYCPPCKIARPAPLRTRCGRTGCSTVALRSPGVHPGLLSVLYVSPANPHLLRVEPRGFEPLTSAVQRRQGSLLELSGVCKISANTHIFCVMPFPSFQDIYSGCCTIAAHVMLSSSRLYSPAIASSAYIHRTLRNCYSGTGSQTLPSEASSADLQGNIRLA